MTEGIAKPNPKPAAKPKPAVPALTEQDIATAIACTNELANLLANSVLSQPLVRWQGWLQTIHGTLTKAQAAAAASHE